MSLLGSIALAALGACGGNDSGGDTADEATLVFSVVRCHEDGGAGVFGPDTLEIRRGDEAPVVVMEVPASSAVAGGACRLLGLARFLPGGLVSNSTALTRVGVTPDGSAAVFEVTDEFSSFPRNLSPEQRRIYFVGSDGGGLRAIGAASRAASGSNSEGFRFSPDGRRVVFNDLGPDHEAREASQVVWLDVTTGARIQVTFLSPHPSGAVGEVCCTRFIDDQTIAFWTTLNADGMHPEGGVFVVRDDGSELKGVPLPVALPDSRIDPNFAITGDQPAAATFSLPGKATNPHDGIEQIREVFVVDQSNLLQLTNFRRVDTRHALLGVDRRRVFFTASTNELGTNPDENCQLFSLDVSGADLRQLTSFGEGQRSLGCIQNFVSPGCVLSRVFQDRRTRRVAFVSNCDPLGSNPHGVQVFSVRPDGTELRQLTSLQGARSDASGAFSAELLGPFAYPGIGSSSGE